MKNDERNSGTDRLPGAQTHKPSYIKLAPNLDSK